MLTAVKLFNIEEPKESQPAACGRCACEAEAGCDSFGSSTWKSLTAVTTSIQMDLPVVAGVEDEDQRSDSRLF